MSFLGINAVTLEASQWKCPKNRLYMLIFYRFTLSRSCKLRRGIGSSSSNSWLDSRWLQSQDSEPFEQSQAEYGPALFLCRVFSLKMPSRHLFCNILVKVFHNWASCHNYWIDFRPRVRNALDHEKLHKRSPTPSHVSNVEARVFKAPLVGLYSPLDWLSISLRPWTSRYKVQQRPM